MCQTINRISFSLFQWFRTQTFYVQLNRTNGLEMNVNEPKESKRQQIILFFPFAIDTKMRLTIKFWWRRKSKKKKIKSFKHRHFTWCCLYLSCSNDGLFCSIFFFFTSWFITVANNFISIINRFQSVPQKCQPFHFKFMYHICESVHIILGYGLFSLSLSVCLFFFCSCFHMSFSLNI